MAICRGKEGRMATCRGKEERMASCREEENIGEILEF